MVVTFDKLEDYLRSLGKNYSILFNFDKGDIYQLKIHYAAHVGEFYYSFRSNTTIDTTGIDSIDLDTLNKVSFYSGLLISSFEKEQFDELAKNIEENEHFTIQKPDVMNKLQKSMA